MLDEIANRDKELGLFVHCITNYVTANDCANMVLACGGHPVMADSPCEVEEVTTGCDALVINMGTLSESKVTAMLLAGKRANALTHPVILDPVGIGASTFRLKTALQLLEEIKFSVIRGNASEIKNLYLEGGQTKGVDVGIKDRISKDTIEEACQTAKLLAKRTKTVVVLTGSTDIVTDGERTYFIYNGHTSMSKITGTGCMLTSVIGLMCAAVPKEPLKAAITGVTAMGICGEIAYEKMIERNEGSASLRVHLIDAMSNMTESTRKARTVMKEVGE